MHEFVNADRVLQTVLEHQKEHPGVKVSQVKVELGELLGLSPASLKMAFGVLSKETSLGDVKLSVRKAKGSVKCDSCGYSGRLEGPAGHTADPVIACPKCGAPLSLGSGNALNVLSFY